MKFIKTMAEKAAKLFVKNKEFLKQLFVITFCSFILIVVTLEVLSMIGDDIPFSFITLFTRIIREIIRDLPGCLCITCFLAFLWFPILLEIREDNENITIEGVLLVLLEYLVKCIVGYIVVAPVVALCAGVFFFILVMIGY